MFLLYSSMKSLKGVKNKKFSGLLELIAKHDSGQNQIIIIIIIILKNQIIF